MTKQLLLISISTLLSRAIEAYEFTDLHLEVSDRGTLQDINHHLQYAVESLRQARRAGRVLLEEYEDDLTKKPEYANLIMAIDEDEDEGEDEDEE